MIRRSGQDIRIGTGAHHGLVIGKPDLVILDKVLEMLRRLYKEDAITPSHFVLKELQHCFVEKGVGVQEFIDSPTLNDALNFLKGREDAIYLDQISERAKALCTNFFSAPENINLTIGVLKAADQELYEHSTQLAKYGRRTIFSERNVLVLGQNEDGKVIIAPVDVE